MISSNGTSKKKQNSFYQHTGYNINKYWQPGQPLTQRDLTMLAETKQFFEQNGYTPAKEEISNSQQLKERFRTWKNVLIAAGLPDRNEPENQRKRMEALNRQKTENL
ncbi:MAG: hypothetical protein IIV99_06270 [Oscillospiraceae bacterium]|nr:hypothetical protein [Oscillospiraceae bacterium]